MIYYCIYEYNVFYETMFGLFVIQYQNRIKPSNN